MIKFTFECEPEKFEKYCKTFMIGKNDALRHFQAIGKDVATKKLNEELDR